MTQHDTAWHSTDTAQHGAAQHGAAHGMEKHSLCVRMSTSSSAAVSFTVESRQGTMPASQHHHAFRDQQLAIASTPVNDWHSNITDDIICEVPS